MNKHLENEQVYTGWGLLRGWEDTSNPPYAGMVYDDSTNWATICDACGAAIAEGNDKRKAIYAAQEVVNKYCPSCGKYLPTFHYEQR